MPSGDDQRRKLDSTCDLCVCHRCDGAHSRVREIPSALVSRRILGGLFYVADAAVSGAGRGEIYLALRKAGLGLMIPVRSSGTQRLIGLVPP